MNDANRRSHFRAQILIPVKWRVLSKGERELVKEGLGSNLFREHGLPGPIEEFLEQTPPGSNEEQMYRSLQVLNNKLDFIIEQVLSESVYRTSNQDEINEISASGLKFASRERADIGTFLKMDLIMPGTFQYRMELIAEVVRVQEKGDGFIIAARIVHINEDARDSIVKMVFKKQRLDIRRLKDGLEDEDIA